MVNKMKDVALLLTQYERFGSIGEKEYIQYYIDEVLEMEESDIWLYNEYLAENNYETYFTDLDEILQGCTPTEIARMCYYGDFNYAYEYHKFNGYNNIDSFETYQVVKEMNEDKDFIKWYIEQNELIDFESDEVIEEIKKANELIKLGY